MVSVSPDVPPWGILIPSQSVHGTTIYSGHPMMDGVDDSVGRGGIVVLNGLPGVVSIPSTCANRANPTIMMPIFLIVVCGVEMGARSNWGNTGDNEWVD